MFIWNRVAHVPFSHEYVVFGGYVSSEEIEITAATLPDGITPNSRVLLFRLVQAFQYRSEPFLPPVYRKTSQPPSPVPV